MGEAGLISVRGVRRVLRKVPASVRLSACVGMEAMRQAGFLGSGGGEGMGIIVAGSNLHQEFLVENARKVEGGGSIDPRYALSFLDTHQVGCLSELFSILGMGYTVGGASASGGVALYQALQWVRSGVMGSCLVVGASPDYSVLEREGFSVLGAACLGEGYGGCPGGASRPFDRGHAGFVLGRGCGGMVVEARDLAMARGAEVLGEILGGAVVLDGNHLSDPSVRGESRAMREALMDAGVGAGEVGYINAHGTSSPLGDAVECEAIKAVFGGLLGGMWVNASKSLLGHCMSAAGVVEGVGVLVQLRGGFLHPNLNLEDPIDEEVRFVGSEAVGYSGCLGMSNSFGFGGINSSLVMGVER
ncbi:MAG: Polyketide biosynthesis malonyl-ACP decarboxylase PksF [Verrucomicrobia subdivision 3 bacterium]|nr:Polyketide biosynthesis malonyl-ACP decarboxylase PksF [Limisphaerales bacterium]MCS1417637.1 Polyketide biosynthesis malonyl-ACP decarboxylase PksF [Limisphaerales bacterium]